MKERIVLLGPPASGKGTQAELIKERFHLEPTSPGAMLREQKAAGTPLGLEAAKFTEQGQLVPDHLVVELVRAWLEGHAGGFIFDGFPRTLGQAAALEKLLAERGAPLEAAISLEVEMSTIEDRVRRRLVCVRCGNVVSLGLHVSHPEKACPRCGGELKKRPDDTIETLKERMVEYHAKSHPLIDYYASRGILHTIHADRAPEEVFADISAILLAPDAGGKSVATLRSAP